MNVPFLTRIPEPGRRLSVLAEGKRLVPCRLKSRIPRYSLNHVEGQGACTAFSTERKEGSRWNRRRSCGPQPHPPRSHAKGRVPPSGRSTLEAASPQITRDGQAPPARIASRCEQGTETAACRSRRPLRSFLERFESGLPSRFKKYLSKDLWTKSRAFSDHRRTFYEKPQVVFPSSGQSPNLYDGIRRMRAFLSKALSRRPPRYRRPGLQRTRRVGSDRKALRNAAHRKRRRKRRAAFRNANGDTASAPLRPPLRNGPPTAAREAPSPFVAPSHVRASKAPLGVFP